MPGLTTLAFAGGLIASVGACTPATGYHPHVDVPENHARVHKPDYIGGDIEHGELEPVDPQADIVRGDPPPRVGAPWSDPHGDPDMLVTAVVIDIGIAEACGIEDNQAYFGYDSAELSEGGEQTVAALAECFTDGPLAGHDLEIVGHTDPRGSDAYNEELGESRAESVASILIRNGVPKQRIAVESHGEEHAHDDPVKWPQDRRVDVRI